MAHRLQNKADIFVSQNLHSLYWRTFQMDDLKDLDDNFSHPVDVSRVKFYLQKGDAKLALHHSQILLAEDPNQVQVLLFATIAARSIGWLDEAFTYAKMQR